MRGQQQVRGLRDPGCAVLSGRHLLGRRLLLRQHLRGRERRLRHQRWHLPGQSLFGLWQRLAALLLQRHLLQPWLLLNVIVAFLHYAYDGLILRRGKSL